MYIACIKYIKNFFGAYTNKSDTLYFPSPLLSEVMFPEIDPVNFLPILAFSVTAIVTFLV
jgi:hypothetical protein